VKEVDVYAVNAEDIQDLMTAYTNSKVCHCVFFFLTFMFVFVIVFVSYFFVGR
jgi:hypothetical protein